MGISRSARLGLLTGLALTLAFLAPPDAAAKKKKNKKEEQIEKQAQPGAIAVIGEQVITKEGFLRYWDALPAGKRTSYERAGGKKDFLDDLIAQKLLIAEAVARGLDQDPDNALQIELARDKVLYAAIYDDAVVGSVVPEASLKEYYDNNLDRYATPEMVRARHILVTPKKDERLYNELKDDAEDEDSAKEKIKRIQQMLADGETFDAVAKKYSEGPTASRGGDLGYFPRNRMVKPFEEAAFALEVGRVSDPVKTTFGYHLILVEEKKPAGHRSFEETRLQILALQKRDRTKQLQESLDVLVATLKEKYGVKLHEGELEK